MNINLANIDFAPGQGGGGEAVIRALDVTENGTYRAPSGVDGYSPVRVNVSGGGSVTPEEQEALDTLVNSSEGVLYTETYERYHQKKYYDGSVPRIHKVFDDLYYIYERGLYKLNKETYSFDKINNFVRFYSGPTFFGDKSGRLYWNGKELDLENGTIGQVQVNLPEYYQWELISNVFYGEYAVWILGSYAYKFNESSQVFEQMTLNSTFGYGGVNVYTNIFKYDGHILGVYENRTFEITEYEDHIDVADVTGVYFNMPQFSTSYYSFKSTKDGDLYYIEGPNVYRYDKTLGNWENIQNFQMLYPIYGYSSFVSDNLIYSIGGDVLYYMNLGAEFNITSWKKTSGIAVDLTSDQEIAGNKTFKGQVVTTSLSIENVDSQNNIMINARNYVLTNIGKTIIFANDQLNKTIVKNGTKQIATVDQTFINSTFIPYGKDGDNVGYITGLENRTYNFNTYTNRIFMKIGNDWFEFDGTNTLIPVSFGFDFSGILVFNSPTMTINVVWDNNTSTNNTYLWNDANTRFDLICSSTNISWDMIWFDGDNFRSGNEWKLVETGGVWSWVSDPLVNNIYEYYYRFGYKNGEVYAYNDNDWHLYKYDKVNCTMDKIGFLNVGSRLYSYYDQMFFKMGNGEVYIIDLSKVDPQNPDEQVLGDMLFTTLTDEVFIGARDRLWYYNTNLEMCSSYNIVYDVPEVPGSDGTYTLKAVRVGDQITYGWVLDV